MDDHRVETERVRGHRPIAAVLGKRPTMFTAADVCVLSGASYRQVDHWARTGYLRPRETTLETGGNGCGLRLYSPDQVLIARALRVVSAMPILQLVGEKGPPFSAEVDGVRITVEVDA